MSIIAVAGDPETPRAGDGIRTHDNDVGNVVLYQLSYTRIVWPLRSLRHKPAGSLDKSGTKGL
jgi:hypothetical protein